MEGVTVYIPSPAHFVPNHREKKKKLERWHRIKRLEPNRNPKPPPKARIAFTSECVSWTERSEKHRESRRSMSVACLEAGELVDRLEDFFEFHRFLEFLWLDLVELVQGKLELRQFGEGKA